jgi:hypothetical protein
MRLQLTRAAAAAVATLCAVPVVRADDRVDASTSWYLERRKGGQGALSVLHPQLDASVDAGDHATLGVGYAADVVSGATASVYSVDATSSATRFSDTRQETSLDLGFHGSRSAITFAAGAGAESDYTSITGSVNGNVDLPGKNTNLALSYTHNFDQVCDRDNGMATALERRALTGAVGGEAHPCVIERVIRGKDDPGVTVWRELSIDTAQATWTQNVSPTLALQTSLFGQVLRGFQANPYRRVRVSGIEAQENLPEVRGRLALMVQANRYIERVRGTAHGSLRGYSDTWGVSSGALEMGYSQYAGDALLLHLRGRIYQQSAATFFKDAFFYDTEGPAGEYFTGDRELAPVRNVLFGGKLSYIGVNQDGGPVWGVFDEVELDLKADVLLLDELPANSLDDNPMGIDNQFLSSGQLIDAIVLQLALQTAF